MENTEQEIISIKNLRKSFGNTEIIKGISDERIKKLEMNKQSFYQVLKAHYKENCNYEMAEEIQ